MDRGTGPRPVMKNDKILGARTMMTVQHSDAVWVPLAKNNNQMGHLRHSERRAFLRSSSRLWYLRSLGCWPPPAPIQLSGRQRVRPPPRHAKRRRTQTRTIPFLFFCAHHIIVIFESTTFSPSLSSPDSDPSPLEAELLRRAIGPPPPAPSITPALPTHSSIGAFIAAAS